MPDPIERRGRWAAPTVAVQAIAGGSVHARIPVAGHVLPSPVPDGGDYLLSVVEGIIVT